jgi:hypothetical protein
MEAMRQRHLADGCFVYEGNGEDKQKQHWTPSESKPSIETANGVYSLQVQRIVFNYS